MLTWFPLGGRTGEQRIHRRFLFVSTLTVLLGLAVMIASAHADPSPAPSLLSGQVLDAHTGAPVVDAHIRVEDLGRVTAADADGGFLFADLPPGEHRLTLSHVAYTSVTRTVHIREGLPTRITVALEPRVREAAAPLLVTAPREDLYRIGRTAIERSTWHDAGDALRTLPGVNLYETGGPGGRKTVSLRGSRPDHVIVRVDGVALNDGTGEAVDLSTIPAADIVAIDVHPTAEPGAPGGRIDITTRASQPPSAPVRDVSGALEGQRPEAWRAEANAGYGGPERSIHLHSGVLKDRGHFTYLDEHGATSRRLNNDRFRVNGFALVQQQLSDEVRAHVKVTADGGRYGSPGPLFQAPTPDAFHEESTWRFDTGIRRNRKGALSSLNLFAISTRRRYVSPRWQYNPRVGEDVLHVPVDVRDTDLRTGLLTNLGSRPASRDGHPWSGRLEAGTSLERYESVDRLSTGVTVDRTAGTVQRFTAHLALNGESLVEPDGWRLRTLGTVRGDLLEDRVANDLGPGLEHNVSGSLRFVGGPSTGPWSLHIGAGTAYAPPSFVSRFLVESVFALGNPHLKPERIAELSWGANLRRDVDGFSVLVTANQFNRITRDLVVWRRNSRGQYFPDNLGRVTANGVELALDAQGGSILSGFGGSLTIQRVLNDDPGSIHYGLRIPFQPDWFGNAHLTVGPAEWVQATLESRFSSRRYTSESNLDPYSTAGGGLAPYTVFDLILAHTFQAAPFGVRGRIAVTVDNVTGESYELLDRMPMPGRVWRLKLELGNLR